MFLVRRYSLINASKKCYYHSDQTTSKFTPICRGFARVAPINGHGNGENLPNSCEFEYTFANQFQTKVLNNRGGVNVDEADLM